MTITIRGFFFRFSGAMALGFLLGFGTSVRAEEPKPAPPIAIVEQADVAELTRILHREVPSDFAEPVAVWFNRIIARTAERQKAQAAATAPQAAPDVGHP